MMRMAVAVVVLLTAGYGGFRVVRHFAFAPPGVVVPVHVCGKPAVGPLSQHPVVAFGDSLTWGWGASHNCVSWPTPSGEGAHRVGRDDTTYPGVLSRLLGQQVLNYGVPGETTAQGVRRFVAILRAVRPRHVYLLEGTNDAIEGVSPATTAQRLRRMAAMAPGRVTLLRLPPVQRQTINRRIASVNRLLPGAISTGHLTATMWFNWEHPNDRGYATIARAVARGR